MALFQEAARDGTTSRVAAILSRRGKLGKLLRTVYVDNDTNNNDNNDNYNNHDNNNRRDDKKYNNDNNDNNNDKKKKKKERDVDGY